MSKAYQCDICKGFYLNNKNTQSKVITHINDFKLSGTKQYSLSETNTNVNIKADICPNCTKRIQDTIDNIIIEHSNILRKK